MKAEPVACFGCPLDGGWFEPTQAQPMPEAVVRIPRSTLVHVYRLVRLPDGGLQYTYAGQR